MVAHRLVEVDHAVAAKNHIPRPVPPRGEGVLQVEGLKLDHLLDLGVNLIETSGLSKVSFDDQRVCRANGVRRISGVLRGNQRFLRDVSAQDLDVPVGQSESKSTVN